MLTAVILAGGKSTRMGSDKAMLLLNGQTLLHRTAAACIDVHLPVIVVGRAAPDGWILDPVRFMPDDQIDQGPLIGIATALRAAGSDIIALACDMPNISITALSWLIDEPPSEPHGIIARSRKGLEPLFSRYTKDALAHIDHSIATGERSCHRCIRSGLFSYRDIPDRLQAAVINLNTPEDVERMTG